MPKFEDLKLSSQDKIKKIMINDVEVQVKQYLSTAEKYALINLVINNSFENNVFNEVLCGSLFPLYVVVFYTDIEFSEEDNERPLDLFDILVKNDVISKVIKAIPEIEWQDLVNVLSAQKETNIKVTQSIGYVIEQFMDVLPKKIESLKELVDNFDPKKYQAVIDFATAANGGRDIKTNQPIEKAD